MISGSKTLDGARGKMHIWHSHVQT